METHRVELKPEDYERLNALYPESKGSGLIGKRAEEIVRILMEHRSPGCTFQTPDPGADLKAVFCDGSDPLLIEVKGTASVGIAWQQLKVSSRHSHKLLVGGVPVYRVTDVFSAAPVVYILRHGVDFVLEEEARWAFKPSTATSQHVTNETAEETVSSGNSVEDKLPSKYNALRHYLERQHDDELTLAFRDAPELLGFSLPPSAHKHQAFWANQTDTTSRPWARAWQEAGFEIDGCRLADDGWVRFKRRRLAP